MDQSGGTSHNAEMPVPNASQGPPRTVPSFVCVLPCTNPSVKYLDRLDGCANGLHATLEDIQDLNVLHGKMTDAIVAHEDQSIEDATAEPCTVCLASVVPSQVSPVLYMENCRHYAHYDCLCEWIRTREQPHVAGCPKCRVASSRAFIWPQLFRTPAHKDELFQLQKRGFGIDVAPKTALVVSASSFRGFPYVHVTINGQKSFTLRKKHENLLPRPRPQAQPAPAPVPQPEPQVAPQPQPQTPTPLPVNVQDPVQPTPLPPYIRAEHEVTERHLVEAIQELHWAKQPGTFYLGDILPLEENAQYQARYRPKAPLYDREKREKMLLQFKCPHLVNEEARSCFKGEFCPFFHAWPENTPAFIQERVKVHLFPNFFCVMHSLFPETRRCYERIQSNSQEPVRCSNGFHPTTQDLQNMDAFAHKIAKHIMAPVQQPEPKQLACAFCRQTAEPNSVWMHMENCDHVLHVQCVPLVRHIYAHLVRKLHCPACQVPSVRTIAWPGPFRSDLVKQTILDRQLTGLRLSLYADVQLAIVQEPNREDTFTIDIGRSRVFTIDATQLSPGHTRIEYD